MISLSFCLSAHFSSSSAQKQFDKKIHPRSSSPIFLQSPVSIEIQLSRSYTTTLISTLNRQIFFLRQIYIFRSVKQHDWLGIFHVNHALTGAQWFFSKQTKIKRKQIIIELKPEMNLKNYGTIGRRIRNFIIYQISAYKIPRFN